VNSTACCSCDDRKAKQVHAIFPGGDEPSAKQDLAIFPGGDEPIEGLCGLGCLWLIHDNKLIVAGFLPGSDAPRAGVKTGDILQEVDNVIVVSTITQTGQDHPAGKLMVGDWGTTCTLRFLRVKDDSLDASSHSSSSAPPADSTQISDCLVAEQVTCRVVRLLPIKPPGAQSNSTGINF